MASKSYMNVKSAALQWGLSERRVRILCSEGRVDGVIRNGWAWNIPANAPKPEDGRTLRHIRNTRLRPGPAHFKELDEKSASLTRENLTGYLIPTVSGLLAMDGLTAPVAELSTLLSHTLVPSLGYDKSLLAINVYQILGDALAGETQKPFNEIGLKACYRALTHGVVSFDNEYRDGKLPAGGESDGKLFSVEQQMAIMVYQYEQEWQNLHPLIRASFLFGELMRIVPFEPYGGVFASLVFNLELIRSNFPFVAITPGMVGEIKADLALTRKRGNYRKLISLFEQTVLSYD